VDTCPAGVYHKDGPVMPQFQH